MNGIKRNASLLLDRNLRQFYVRVGNNSQIDQHVVCHYYGGEVPSEENVNIFCERDLVGSYVSIQKTTNYPGTGYLHLCEVEVFGYTINESLYCHSFFVSI